ncbi:Vacuolar protein sorting-associated protein 53 [Coemansia thaxteri]|nr:Vacuolar protein sorting-associated protein 53 [Coemansia thaxteri]KAJ2474124.1 Vacuolar protein sorting-associated protein 53 [Coemansia sp. RSA 2322]
MAATSSSRSSAGRRAASAGVGETKASSPASAAAAGVQLDSAEFATELYLDRLFVDESSLEGVDVAAENLRRRLLAVTQDIRQLLRAQSNDNSKQQTQSLEATKDAIGELYTRISEMKAKARTSERMVLDITQDIKSLDFAKRNLTQTTTTMKRLQMLIGAVAQLRHLKEQSKYYEASQLLQAISGLREGFAGFGRVRQIAALNESADALQRSLASQAFQEVERGFDAQGMLVGDARVMRDACLCAQASLGDEQRDKFVSFYCELQLRAYSAIFQLGDDVSQLENISRRYAWLRRILRNYTDDHAAVFPEQWRVGEVLSRRFAEATRDHLGEIMATNEDTSVEHLMTALVDTLAFEAQCDKKFAIVLRHGATGKESPEPRLSTSSLSTTMHIYEDSSEPATTFTGTISCAFEPYMSIFIRGENAKFDEMIRKFQREPLSIDNDPSLSVLASSTDLLYQFRESLRQCASLSTGQPMVDLSQVFSKCLCSYAREVLVHKLPRISGSSTAVLDDLKHICLIINTADYCASVVGQLEQKVVEKVEAEFKEKVSFATCREALLSSINTSIRALVAGVEVMCEPAFAALTQVPWQSLQMVGDQSGYVLLVSSAMEASTETIRKSMSGPRYFRSYCDKFAARFAERYMAAINTCGQISEVGAEQLLLDAQALKSALLDIPLMGAERDEAEKKKPPLPAAYTKIVTQGVGRIEALLKAILAPSDPPDALVDRFVLLFPKAPKETFQQILNIKGVKPADQPSYFRILQRMLKESGAAANSLDRPKASQETPPASRKGATATTSSSSGSSTPHLKGTTPAHGTHGISSSVPLGSKKPQPRFGEHARIGSASSSKAMFGGSEANSQPAAAQRTSTYSPTAGHYSTPLSAGMSSGVGIAATNHGQSPATRGLRPDPLGITGGVSTSHSGGINAFLPAASAHSVQAVFSPTSDDSSFGNDDVASRPSADATNSPVLASLAANATATRTKINENLRKFMSNMRRN